MTQFCRAGGNGRAQAAAHLASALGAETVLLFVRDPVLGELIPAPGLPQTVRAGPSWREFLARCRNGRCSGQVEQPPGTIRTALALTCDGAALIALGGPFDEVNVVEVERALPLLAALLQAEQHAVLAQAEAASANEVASRATALAAALDAARGDAATLNAELREEQRRKDEFLAMLGHELRNPLAPLMNSVELLRRMQPAQPLPRQMLDMMARQIKHLTRLIDDLLDASRVSRGRIELKRESLLVSDVIRDAVAETRDLVEERGQKLTLSGIDEPLAVSGDRVRLTQVFANLLNNAAKYTEPGGRISLSVSREAANAVVSLTDTGIGIASEMQPRVFELFAQAPGSLKHAQGGLGIGLTLVRMLVDLHGGRVSVASPGPGKGSTFTVVLPLIETLQFTGAAETFDRPREASAPLHVMIVDDNRDAADSIALLLKQMGHEAEVAYSGQKALESNACSEADVVLLDIGLPGMDGYELARRLRPVVKASTRFIALTGFGTPDRAQRSADAGFDEHVVKPVTADVLRQILNTAKH